MAIPNKQIGWSQESNLLWNISSQLDRLTKVIANLSPGGGGTNIYNSDGTLTGNRTFNGGNFDLYAPFFSNIILDFNSGGTGFFGNQNTLNGLSIDLFNQVFRLGDQGNNLDYLELNCGTSIFKSVFNGNNIGLKLDFANDQYTIGNAGATINNSYILLDNANGSFIQEPTNIKIGDGANYGNNTYLLIADNNNEISTYNAGNNIGLKLDFANSDFVLGDLFNNSYFRDNINTGQEISSPIGITIGDINPISNSCDLSIIQNPFFLIKTRYNSTDVGLKLDFANTTYQLGQITGGNATFLTIDDAANYPVQLTGTNISSGTAGAASGQFLKIKVGGVDYKIALLNP